MIKLITMQPGLNATQVQNILQYVLSLSPSRPIAKSWESGNKQYGSMQKNDKDMVSAIVLSLNYLRASHGYTDQQMDMIITAVNRSAAFVNSEVALPSPYSVKRETLSNGTRK
jgi:hypothetical protein